MRCTPKAKATRFLLACFAALVVGAQAASLAVSAETPSKEIQRYFDALQSFRADFVQEVARGDRNRDVSRGRVVLQRPNRFRWDYLEPYEQLVLGDGEKLWHFDADLAQVTVQELGDALGRSPLSQLMSGTPIDRLFRVELLGGTPEGAHYRLSPLGPDAEFGSLELRFRGGELAVLVLEDALGQLTRVEFFDIVTNAEVPADTWIFQPPPGADVIGDV